MNKAQFRTIVNSLQGIASARGATSEVEEDAFIARFPAISLTVFVDDGPIGAHWHSAARDLAPEPFDSINDGHKRKGTHWRSDWPGLFAAIEATAEAIVDGSVFA